MRRKSFFKIPGFWGLLLLLLLLPVHTAGATSPVDTKQLIFDEAGLLTDQQANELNAKANEYRLVHDTDFIILTSDNPSGEDVQKLMGDFYDEYERNSDVRNVNVVMLTLDMMNRQVYVSGFYKGMEYVDNNRANELREMVTPYLSSGDYEQAFTVFLDEANEFMNSKPSYPSDSGSGGSGYSGTGNTGGPSSGYSPVESEDGDNILFNGWFQLAVSLGLGGIVVGIMAYNAGGRVTVNRFTYEDAINSGVVAHRDHYLRTSVSKRKIERNNSSGGGGGGGTTGGGHSHSGSRGSF